MRLQYVLGEAFRNMGRNALVVLGAVLAVFITIAITLAALVGGEIVRINVQTWSDDVRVVAFLRDDLSFEDQQALRDSVASWDEVESAFIFSKLDAFEEAQRLLKDRPTALRIIEEDPGLVLASLRIKPVEASQYQTIADNLSTQVGIEKVISAGPAIDNMVALRDGLRFMFLGLAVVLGAASVFLIANTIHMAIYARREEIEIMKLVGAGGWFVRTPFIVEGVLEGVVGATAAVGLMVLLLDVAQSQVQGLPDWIDISVTRDFLFSRSILAIAFGAIVGLLGSAISLAFQRILRPA